MDYLTDALGSVTATVNQSAQVVNTYRYKPYGTQLAKTGTGSDPAFGWVGTQGYRPTQKKFSGFYVIARHYGDTTGQWTTPDPARYIAGLNTYSYVGGNPVIWIDPSGLIGIIVGNPPRVTPIPGTCGANKFEIKWQVPKGFTGYVVQHIVMSSNITDCNGRKIPTKDIEYWERWIVVNGIVYGANHTEGSLSGGATDDTFQTPGQTNNTRGCATIHGYAENLAKLPPGLGWIYVPPAGSPTGMLPYVPGGPGKPGWPGWVEKGGVSHWLRSCWNCCPATIPWAPVSHPCDVADKP